jgi:hypothetical protein
MNVYCVCSAKRLEVIGYYFISKGIVGSNGGVPPDRIRLGSKGGSIYKATSLFYFINIQKLIGDL